MKTTELIKKLEEIKYNNTKIVENKILNAILNFLFN